MELATKGIRLTFFCMKLKRKLVPAALPDVVVAAGVSAEPMSAVARIRIISAPTSAAVDIISWFLS